MPSASDTLDCPLTAVGEGRLTPLAQPTMTPGGCQPSVYGRRTGSLGFDSTTPFKTGS